jgi:5-bromo-4-chloroindolyl phosphate hydrolysis protein
MEASMAKQVKRSVLPIYLVGVTWLVTALFFSLRSMGDYLTCAAVSAVVFIVGKAIFPDKTFTVPDQEKKQEKKQPEKPKTTGDAKIDALIKERERAISEMRRLNDAIEDEKISAQIDHLEQTTGKIIDHVVAHPKKLPQISRFMSYYLPTTIKLLNAYDRMSVQGIEGENISGTITRIEDMLDTVVVSYKKQLDALFADEALDIETDIKVMDGLLQREGLKDKEL